VTKLLLVGCGKMGGALLAGWLDQGIAPSDIVIVDPHFTEEAPKGVRVFADSAQAPPEFRPDIILLAVKPQTMDQALPAYAGFRDAIFLSIAAGRTVASLERHLGRVAIARAMPNTPAQVGRGVSVLYANAQVRRSGRDLCETLMRAVGTVAWTGDEADMDAVTALSGSGPAYVFLLVEALAAAGEAMGLDKELAMTLARATVEGSGELLHRSPLSAATLRENVTSPNGTTYAALQVLGAPDGLFELMRRATAAAAKRAKELAG
jgi:pyrroline-5-carboxylate reductase